MVSVQGQRETQLDDNGYLGGGVCAARHDILKSQPLEILLHRNLNVEVGGILEQGQIILIAVEQRSQKRGDRFCKLNSVQIVGPGVIGWAQHARHEF